MTARIIKLHHEGDYQSQVQSCTRLLDDGGLVVVPMETVYGALARVDRPEALRRLRELRGWPESRALPLHIPSVRAAWGYLDPPNLFAQKLMCKLWPGPVAMLFRVSQQRREELANTLRFSMADLFDGNYITLRCPAHPVAREVLSNCKAPVAAVVAYAEANRVDEIAQVIAEKVDMIIDDGPCHYGKPSTVIRVDETDFDIIRPGVYDRRILDKMLQVTILFVCSGNTCRSPLAQAIARKTLADRLNIQEKDLERSGYQVLSAGVMAFPGAPATPHAVHAARDLGADLTGHRSRVLTPQLINQADMIFAMSKGHVEVIKKLVPLAGKKVHTLDPEGEIADPIGGDLTTYQTVATHMKKMIDRRLADQSLFGLENAS